MKVMIDDELYVRAPEVPTDKGLLTALEIRFDSDAGDNITIRDYLRLLLVTLWDQAEGFSGKRPFGNSGWEYDLYKPLIKGGYVQGTLDEAGYVDEVDKSEANDYVFKLIAAAFNGVSA